MAGKGNLENLKPIKQTSKQASDAGKIGGVKSGEARRAKRLMREQMEMLLTLPIKSKKIRQQLENLGIESTELTNQMALIVSMYQKALKGDTRAFELLRDTIGEKPKEVHTIEEVPIINDDIN